MVVACGKQGTPPPPNGDPLPRKTIGQVLGEQEDGLMGLSGVVGVNQGECSETPCIRVLVVKKTTDLLRQIPSAIEGYAVDITETGEIKALDDS